MTKPPTLEKPEIVRVTVPVTAEVLETFQRLAKASGMSTGKAMGEWLLDTLDAAEFMTQTVERARSAPATVVREFQAYTHGLNDELSALMEQIRAKGVSDRAKQKAEKTAGEGPRLRGDAPGVFGAITRPPSGNTGGKGTQPRSGARGKLL